MGFVWVWALICPMPFGAVATFVRGCCAFVSLVVPLLAFEASDWLFLDFFHLYFLVAYTQTFGYSPVSSFCISKRNEEMCRFFLRGVSLYWFDPSYHRDFFGFDVVGVKDFVVVGLVL